MRSHYADYHRGFVIGFEHQSLNEELQTGNGWIEYIPEINAEHFKRLKAYMIPFSKHEAWYYEEEWRFISENPEWINNEIQVSTNTISEIILGAKMTVVHKEEMKQYCSKYLPTAEIVEVKLGIDGFKLEFIHA
jgi:hypothetical protein